MRRLYRLEGLQVRMRVRRRKHVASSRARTVPAGPAGRWRVNFVHDALADGSQFRVPTLVDQWSRQSYTLDVASCLSGQTVSVTVDDAISESAAPLSITARSSFRARSSAGRISEACSSTSFGRGNPLKTPSSSYSTGASATSV